MVDFVNGKPMQDPPAWTNQYLSPWHNAKVMRDGKYDDILWVVNSREKSNSFYTTTSWSFKFFIVDPVTLSPTYSLKQVHDALVKHGIRHSSSWTWFKDEPMECTTWHQSGAKTIQNQLKEILVQVHYILNAVKKYCPKETFDEAARIGCARHFVRSSKRNAEISRLEARNKELINSIQAFQNEIERNDERITQIYENIANNMNYLESKGIEVKM